MLPKSYFSMYSQIRIFSKNLGFFSKIFANLCLLSLNSAVGRGNIRPTFSQNLSFQKLSQTCCSLIQYDQNIKRTHDIDNNNNNKKALKNFSLCLTDSFYL